MQHNNILNKLICQIYQMILYFILITLLTFLNGFGDPKQNKSEKAESLFDNYIVIKRNPALQTPTNWYNCWISTITYKIFGLSELYLAFTYYHGQYSLKTYIHNWPTQASDIIQNKTKKYYKYKFRKIKDYYLILKFK